LIFDKFGKKENKIRKILILLEENGVLGEPIWDRNRLFWVALASPVLVLGEPIWDRNSYRRKGSI